MITNSGKDFIRKLVSQPAEASPVFIAFGVGRYGIQISKLLKGNTMATPGCSQCWIERRQFEPMAGKRDGDPLCVDHIKAFDLEVNKTVAAVMAEKNTPVIPKEVKKRAFNVPKKHCKGCGEEYQPTGNAQRLCQKCRDKIPGNVPVRNAPVRAERAPNVPRETPKPAKNAAHLERHGFAVSKEFTPTGTGPSKLGAFEFETVAIDQYKPKRFSQPSKYAEVIEFVRTMEPKKVLKLKCPAGMKLGTVRDQLRRLLMRAKVGDVKVVQNKAEQHVAVLKEA